MKQFDNLGAWIDMLVLDKMLYGSGGYRFMSV